MNKGSALSQVQLDEKRSSISVDKKAELFPSITDENDNIPSSKKHAPALVI